ncbi:MAG: hypothetical protein HDT28_00335 [Clostridiales bacterium]|nr:hypothetical protein [Clostridiales bacterium]
MKKFLLMLMSVLMALFMCFSFVACNNDNDDGGEGDNGIGGEDKAEEVTKNITNAFNNLYTVNGYTGEIKIDATVRTDEQAHESMELSVEKRGDKIKVTLPKFEADKEITPSNGIVTSDAQAVEAKTQTYILDIKTGYAYAETNDGYGLMQAIPANTFDYALAVIKANFAGDNGFKFAGDYNEDTKTATDTLDLASYANKFIQPVYDTYKTGTLLDLIDKYLDSFMGTDFDGVAEKFVGYVTVSNEMSAKTLIDFINETYNYDLNEVFENLGYTKDELESLKSRTVGEIAAGVCDYVDEALASLGGTMTLDGETEGDGEEIGSAEGGGMEQIIMGLVQAAFFDEIDAKWYAETPNALGQKVIDVEKLQPALSEKVALVKATLGTFKANMIVDMIASQNAYVDYMVKNEILVNELKFDYSITFDEDNNIQKIELNAIFSHSLDESKVDKNTPDVFANNGYGYKVTATFANYTDTASDFDITLGKGAYDDATAIVYDLEKDAVVYIENNLETLPATPITAYLVGFDGMPIKELTVAAGDVIVNSEKNTVTVKASFMKAAFEDEKAEVGSSIVIGIGEEQGMILVSIINLPTDQDGIIEYVQMMYEVIGNMGGGMAPDPQV